MTIQVCLHILERWNFNGRGQQKMLNHQVWLRHVLLVASMSLPIRCSSPKPDMTRYNSFLELVLAAVQMRGSQDFIAEGARNYDPTKAWMLYIHAGLHRDYIKVI